MMHVLAAAFVVFEEIAVFEEIVGVAIMAIMAVQ